MEMAFQQSWFSRPTESNNADSLLKKLLMQRMQCKCRTGETLTGDTYVLKRQDLIPEELASVVERAKQSVSISADAFSKARGKANPYECLGKGPRGSAFINRSALKMANMDYCFNIFGEYADQCSSFLDVCGG